MKAPQCSSTVSLSLADLVQGVKVSLDLHVGFYLFVPLFWDPLPAALRSRDEPRTSKQRQAPVKSKGSRFAATSARSCSFNLSARFLALLDGEWAAHHILTVGSMEIRKDLCISPRESHSFLLPSFLSFCPSLLLP